MKERVNIKLFIINGTKMKRIFLFFFLLFILL